MDAGTIISRLLLDESDFNQAIKNTQKLVQRKFAQMEGNVAASVGGMRRQMLKLYQDGKLQSSRLTKTWKTQTKGMQTIHRDVTTKMSKNTKKFADASVAAGKKVEKSWWKTFGAVAVGFTIAYRAMNAIQVLLTELVRTFSKGIQAIDDFRTAVIRTAAALSMLSDEPTTEGLQAYLAYARSTFEQLEVIAARHFATADDLREAYAKFTTMGLVPVGPEQLESMASLVDWILIAEEAMGRTLQIRSEIESVVEGTLRKGAVMARMANQTLDNYKDQLKQIEATASATEKSKMFFEMMAPILSAITRYSDEILKTHMAWRANIDAIFKKIWRAGLNEAYEDLLSIMRLISETLIEHGQLTDTAYKLAYAYNVAWDSLKETLLTIRDIAVGLYRLWDDMTFHLSPVLHTLKLVAMGVITIKAGLEAWVAVLRRVVSVTKAFIKDLALYPAETLKTLATAAFSPLLEKRIKVALEQYEKASERLERYQKGIRATWEELLAPNLENAIQSQSELVWELFFKYEKLLKKQTESQEMWVKLFEAPGPEEMADELQAIIDGLTDDLQAIGDWEPGGGFEEWKETLVSGSKVFEGLLKLQKELLALLKSGGKLSDRQAKDQIKAYALLRSIYKDAIDAGEHYASEFIDAESQLLDAKAERIEKELALVVDAKEAELAAELWYHNEVRKLIEGTRQEQIKQFQMQVDWTSSVVDSWTWMYQQLGQKSRRAFEIYKGLQYAQAIIEALSASIKAYSWGWGPWSGPAAPYVATAAMVTAWVTAMAKAAMISSQQYQGYAIGGWLDTHPGGGKISEGAGGKDDVFLGATPGVRHWAMRDESVFVMNKEDTKKFEAMREAMNQGWASGGWIDKGYGPLDSVLSTASLGLFGGGAPGLGIPGISSIVEWLEKIWEELTVAFAPPEVPFDPDVFAGILHSIDQMLGKTTALDDALYAANQRFDQWHDQLVEMNATAAQLAEVEDQRADVLAYLIKEEKERIALLNKEFMQDLTLRALRILGMEDLADAMALTISQEQELANAIEQGASDATIAFMKEVHAMELVVQEAETLADSISDLESIMSGWEDALQSVQDQILSTMTTLSTSPLDAVERLDLLWDAINNFGEVITPEDVSELQGLYSDVLGVAAEAYQRPSIAYGEEYADVLTGLGDLEDIAEGILSAYDIQLKQLETLTDILAIEESTLNALLFPVWTPPEGPVTFPLPDVGAEGMPKPFLIDVGAGGMPKLSAQHGGTFVGPESGYPVTLHGIERVTPLGGASGSEFAFNLTINESKTPHETGRVVTNAVETFLKSNRGRTLVQDTSKGR